MGNVEKLSSMQGVHVRPEMFVSLLFQLCQTESCLIENTVSVYKSCFKYINRES